MAGETEAWGTANGKGYAGFRAIPGDSEGDWWGRNTEHYELKKLRWGEGNNFEWARESNELLKGKKKI